MARHFLASALYFGVWEVPPEKTGDDLDCRGRAPVLGRSGPTRISPTPFRPVGSRTSSCLNDLFVLCNRSEVTHKSSEFVPKKYGTAFASTRDPAERPGLAKFGMQNAHKLPRRRRIRRVAIRPFRRGQIRACRRGRCAVLRGAAGRRQGRVLYQRLETV